MMYGNKAEMQARLEGQMACLKREPFTANPYPLGDHCSRAWGRGFKEVGGIETAPTTGRAAPADFREHAGESIASLKRRYKVGGETIGAWRTQVGHVMVPHERKGPPATPPPADFAERQKGMTYNQMQAEFGVGVNLLKRWLTVTGISRRAEITKAAQERRERIAQRKPESRPFRHGGYKPAPVDRPVRDFTVEGRAADHLRRWAATYRCSEQGGADPAGSHWRYGRLVMTPDELIERASAKGFQVV